MKCKINCFSFSIFERISDLIVILLGSIAAIACLLTVSDGSSEYKSSNRLLEKRKSWRVAKVSYWIVTSVAVVLLLSINDGYGNYPTVGWGLVLIALAYPLYIIFRHLYLYITGVEAKSDRNKA